MSKHDLPDHNTLLERYQVLVENLAAALVIRSPEGKLTYCSPYTEVLTGYSLEEIYQTDGDFFNEIVHPEDRDTFNKAKDLAQVGESFQVRFRFFHRTGIEIWAEARTAPLRDDSGELLSSLTILLDATRTVKQEEQLVEKNSDLQNITSIAAEEIQNEVFTIQGMLSLLNDGVTQEEMVSALKIASKKLEELAHGLTEFGQVSLQREELRVISLSKVLKIFSEEQQVEGTEIILLEEENWEDKKVMGASEEIVGVLNALADYSASLKGKDASLTLAVKELPHSMIAIELIDNAPLIPEHLALNVFEPYRGETTVKPRRSPLRGRFSKTPFSLSLAKKRMTRLGGSLEYSPIANGESSSNCFLLSLREARSS